MCEGQAAPLVHSLPVLTGEGQLSTARHLEALICADTVVLPWGLMLRGLIMHLSSCPEPGKALTREALGGFKHFPDQRQVSRLDTNARSSKAVLYGVRLAFPSHLVSLPRKLFKG